jgi:hypothetical protein
LVFVMAVAAVRERRGKEGTGGWAKLMEPTNWGIGLVKRAGNPAAEQRKQRVDSSSVAMDSSKF